MNERIPKPLKLAQLPTPIEFLEKPSQRLGVQVYVKRDDLTGGVTGGNKVRKLEYSLAKAVQEKADVIISCGATQTNHGRALAALCNELSLGCRLFLLG
ncbi:MAG: 1-aminocyclopropane-1-carboxylate deaminase, partial [Planctomycetota bacterium]